MARLALSDFHVRQELEKPLLKRIGINDFFQRHLLPRLEREVAMAVGMEVHDLGEVPDDLSAR